MIEKLLHENRECYEPLEKPSCLWWYALQKDKPMIENDCIIKCDGTNKQCGYYAPKEPQIMEENK